MLAQPFLKYLNYSYEQLERFCVDCFKKYGFTEEQSKIISDVLLLSDLYGIESHGMQRMVRYHDCEEGTLKLSMQMLPHEVKFLLILREL